MWFSQSPSLNHQETSCQTPFNVMHVDVRHTESKGVGYKDGYTTIEGFGIYDRCPSFMPFLDLRGHVFNDGKLAGNVGLGERSCLSSINHIFGLYLYYDVRQKDKGLLASDLSPGIELLGKRMEYRLNSYFPVGKHQSHSYQFGFKKFHQNRIILQHKRKFVMKGADAEVGRHLTESLQHDFYLGAGPYYFTAKSGSLWGGKARIYWRYRDYLSLEASYSYDHIFKNIVQGTFSLSYPFGPKLTCKEEQILAARAPFAPHRLEIPVVKSKKHRHAAKDSTTKAPITVWFVNNISHSAGTFESPFPTLAQAQAASGPNDIIYVFPGDGTTNGLNTGIILQDGQKLFGSGLVQHVSTTKGRVRIPAHSATAPTLSNSTQSQIIGIGNNNEIAGFVLTAVGPVNSFALNPIPAIVSNLYVHDNIFQLFNNTSALVATPAGSIRFIHNLFLGTNPTVAQCFILSPAPNTGMTQIDFIQNLFSNVTVPINIISFNPAQTPLNINISQNTFLDFRGNGVFLAQLGDPASVVSITNNVFRNSQGLSALIINPGGASNPDSGQYIIENNTIDTTTAGGAFSSIHVQTSSATSYQLSCSNNNITVGPIAGSIGINLNAAQPGTICTQITNNRIQLTNPSTIAISLTGTPGAINLTDFSGNIAPVVTTVGNVNVVKTCN
jgi:hypothetical protein